jgi:transposase
MAKVTRRRYTDEFRAEAVRLVQTSDRPTAQVARELGIPDNLLYRWVSEERAAHARGSTRAAVHAEADELTRVKRELARVTLERDFLRHAAAFFAKESS